MLEIIAGNESTYEYPEWHTNISAGRENSRLTKSQQKVMLIDFVETFCVMDEEFGQITNYGVCIEVTELQRDVIRRREPKNGEKIRSFMMAVRLVTRLLHRSCFL
jgi:hypothetical protein